MGRHQHYLLWVLYLVLAPNTCQSNHVSRPQRNSLKMLAGELQLRDIPKTDESPMNFSDSFFLKQLKNSSVDARKLLDHLYQTVDTPDLRLRDKDSVWTDIGSTKDSGKTQLVNTHNASQLGEILLNTLALPAIGGEPEHHPPYEIHVPQSNEDKFDQDGFQVDKNPSKSSFSKVGHISTEIPDMNRLLFNSINKIQEMSGNNQDTFLKMINKTKSLIQEHHNHSYTSLLRALLKMAKQNLGFSRIPRDSHTHRINHLYVHDPASRPDNILLTNAEMNLLQIIQRPRLYIAPQTQLRQPRIWRPLHQPERIRGNPIFTAGQDVRIQNPLSDANIDVSPTMSDVIIQEVGDILKPFVTIPKSEAEIVEDFILQQVGEIFTADGMPNTDLLHVLQMVGDVFNRKQAVINHAQMPRSATQSMNFAPVQDMAHTALEFFHVEQSSSTAKPLSEKHSMAGTTAPNTSHDTKSLKINDNSRSLTTDTDSGIDIFLTPIGHILSNLGTSRLLQTLLANSATSTPWPL